MKKKLLFHTVHKLPLPNFSMYNIHCKQRFAVFPPPAGMSLTKPSLAGNNLIIPVLVEFGK